MRISDWSSDVCSSDLQCTGSWDDGAGATGTLRTRRTSALTVISVADQSGPSRVLCPDSTCRQDGAHLLEVEQVIGTHGLAARSAERRVGKECGSTCRFRCSP